MDSAKNVKCFIVMKNLSCFVGYDSKEDIAYRVCKYSLLKRSSINIKVYSLKIDELISHSKKEYVELAVKLSENEFHISSVFCFPTSLK